jgi:hypothetical protein
MPALTRSAMRAFSNCAKLVSMLSNEVARGQGPGRIEPRLAIRAQSHPPPAELLDRGHHVRDGAERPVELPDDDAVDLPAGRLDQQVSPCRTPSEIRGAGVVDGLTCQLWVATNSRSGRSWVSGPWSLSEVDTLA